MTTDQWFAVITLSFTAAFTGLLLWFAWYVLKTWRAARAKRDESKLLFWHDNEYFTPDWELEIRKVGLKYADRIQNEQAKCHQITQNLKRDWADENLELHKRKAKEEARVDDV